MLSLVVNSPVKKETFKVAVTLQINVEHNQRMTTKDLVEAVVEHLSVELEANPLIDEYDIGAILRRED